MSSSYDSLVHLVAGGIGGTVGAITTCPLEVVKTRLQSSVVSLDAIEKQPYLLSQSVEEKSLRRPVGHRFFIYRFIRHIVETEGPKALFKGLGPNLIGVAPSRAIYFCTYSKSKVLCNERFATPDTPLVHICSAASAGFVCSTVTNPIWVIKTRLQLDQNRYGATTALKCIKSLYQESGFAGFYKGITASYVGISETIIHFVIYEFLKSKLQERSDRFIINGNDNKNASHFLQFMIAGAISKTFASVVAYPHEVARTRLRESGTKYRKFFQTVSLVWKEEGREGLYRGLGTQLARQIPNTAIMMATYELVVYLLKSSS